MHRSAFFELYEFLAQMTYQSLPQRVVRLAKLAFMDTIGIMLGATGVDIGRRLLALHDVGEASGGGASIVGSPYKVPQLNAAFLNGSLAEVLEMQDGIRYGGVHPSSTVIPAVLALAQQRCLSGKELILSLVAGYEFLGRMSRAIYPQPMRRGFNMTGICGAFGAAVGCAKLLGFDPDQMANAIGLGGLYAPISSRGAFHYEIKPTHAGRASEAGLLCALITERGIQGAKQILEMDDMGGICTRLIAESKTLDQVSASLGKRFELDEVYFKPYPACRHTHGSIQATLELIHEYDLKPDQVAQVRVSTYDIAKLAVGDRRPVPESIYTLRQFSIPYVVAATLMKGEFWINDIFGDSSQDPKVYALLSKVAVEEDPEITRRYPATTPTRVEITCKNNQCFSRLTERPLGDPASPLGADQLEDKFVKLAAGVLGVNKTSHCLHELSTLEELTDVSALIERLMSSDR